MTFLYTERPPAASTAHIIVIEWLVNLVGMDNDDVAAMVHVPH